MTHRIARSVVALSLSALGMVATATSASAVPEQAFAGDDLFTGVVIGTPLAFIVDHDDVIMTIAHGFGTNGPKCTVVTPPTHGALTYQPDPDLCDFYYTANASFTGSDTFVYSISFGGSLPARAMVTLQSTPAVTTSTTTVAPTTTTTVAATTTTTVAPTTTTTAPVVSATTAAPTTNSVTTAAPAVVLPATVTTVTTATTAKASTVTTAAAAVVLAARALPTTGTDAATMSLLAALLLLGGFAFMWYNRNRKVALHRRKMMQR